MQAARSLHALHTYICYANMIYINQYWWAKIVSSKSLEICNNDFFIRAAFCYGDSVWLAIYFLILFFYFKPSKFYK